MTPLVGFFPDLGPERESSESGNSCFLQRAERNPEAARIHAGQRQR